MFTIDLLRGQGVPAKTKPKDILVATVTFAVPIIITIVMLGFYLTNSVAMAIQKHNLAKYEARTDQLSEILELHKSFQKNRHILCSGLAEVSSDIGRRIQWSPILASVAENIPDSLVITNVVTKQSLAKRQVPSENDPEETVEKSVPIKVLQVKVIGDGQSDCDQVVRDFRSHLLSGDVLGRQLADIGVGKVPETLDNRPVILYQMDCIFKPKF
jgi:hypothetical protein